MRRNASRTGDWFIEFLISEVFVFIKQPFCSPDQLIVPLAGLDEGKKLSGEARSPGSRPRFSERFAKNRAGLAGQFGADANPRFEFQKRSQLLTARTT